MAKMPAAVKEKLNNKPKRRKGPVPPQLKSHLFKPGGKKSATPIGGNKKWNKPAAKKATKSTAAKTGKKPHGNAGKPKSAAHRANISAALRKAWKRRKSGKSIKPKTLKDRKASIKRISKKPRAIKALNNARKSRAKKSKVINNKSLKNTVNKLYNIKSFKDRVNKLYNMKHDPLYYKH